MAYLSKHYASHWRPDGDPASFDATVGRIISHGAFKDTLKAQSSTAAAPSEAATQHHYQQQQPSPQTSLYQRTAERTAGSAGDEQWHTAASSTAGAAAALGGGGGSGTASFEAAASWIGPRPGHSWVDHRGHLLIDGPPATRPPPPAPPRAPPPAAAALAALSPGERSMRIWQRIAPGMLPDTAVTPVSTTAAAFKYPGQLVEAVDMTHHLRKTDFSEYVEARERQHVSLKAKS